MNRREWGNGRQSPDALEAIFQDPVNWVNLSVIGINLVVFVFLEILGDTQDGEFMLEHGAAFAPYILDGQWYRLLTSMFLHFGVAHLFHNMIMLLFVGDMLEGALGKWRYLCVYLGGGLAGNLLSLAWDVHTGIYAVSAGASGAVFAVFGAMIAGLIGNRRRVSKHAVFRLMVVALLMIESGFSGSGVDNAAHVGGFLAGLLLGALLRRRRKSALF